MLVLKVPLQIPETVTGRIHKDQAEFDTDLVYKITITYVAANSYRQFRILN